MPTGVARNVHSDTSRADRRAPVIGSITKPMPRPSFGGTPVTGELPSESNSDDRSSAAAGRPGVCPCLMVTPPVVRVISRPIDRLCWVVTNPLGRYILVQGKVSTMFRQGSVQVVGEHERETVEVVCLSQCQWAEMFFRDMTGWTVPQQTNTRKPATDKFRFAPDSSRLGEDWKNSQDLFFSVWLWPPVLCGSSYLASVHCRISRSYTCREPLQRVPVIQHRAKLR